MESQTEPVDRLYVHARELVTLAGGPATGCRRAGADAGLGVVRDGAIAVKGGRVVATGPTDALLGRYRAREEVDLSGFAVVPGFVDAQTHPVFRRVPAPTGALRRGRREVLASATYDHLWTFVEHGTTSASARAGAGLGLNQEAEALGALRDAAAEVPLRVERVWWVQPDESPPQGEAVPGTRDVALSIARDVILPVARGLADSVALECGEESPGFDREGCAAFARAAGELGLPVRLHADERQPLGGAELAVAIGAMSCHHLGRASLGGRGALASADTVAVLTPAVYLLRDNMHFPPGRSMWDQGVAIALASGFGPGVAVASMPAACALAVACMGLRPEEALLAATLHGAVAMGVDGDVGSLHPGKRCDFAVLDAPSWHEVGMGLGANPVVLTVIDGEPVFANTHEPMPEVLGRGPGVVVPGADSADAGADREGAP